MPLKDILPQEEQICLSLSEKKHPDANLQILGCWNVCISKCIKAKKIDRVNLICLC